jgi:hypothetical protein
VRRLEAELVGEVGAVLVVLVERLGGSTSRIQGSHQGDPGSLAQGQLGDERLQQSHGVCRTTRDEQHFGTPLDGLSTLLLELDGLELGDLGVGELAVRRAAPQAERPLQDLGSSRRRTVARVAKLGPELLGVEVTRGQLEDVAPVAGEQHLSAADGGQGGSELEHGAVQRSRRVLR